MDAKQYPKDKVYLKDARNGRVYEYSRDLAKVRHLQAFVPNPSKKAEPTKEKEQQKEEKEAKIAQTSSTEQKAKGGKSEDKK